MSDPIVECVPNISEGRDRECIDGIVEAAAAVSGVRILDVDPGADTNRTVITFVGAPPAVEEAAFRLIARSAERIDMSRHRGAHARQGATDVCPFVPVSGVSMEQCVAIARRVGARVGSELGLPVYLYEHAAERPERRSLAAIRQGEYEALPEKLRRDEWKPDFGPAEFIPRFGAVTIGAREFLIAYNVNLNTRNRQHALEIAQEIRETGHAVRIEQTSAFYSSGKPLRYLPDEGIFPCGDCLAVLPSFDALSNHVAAAHAKSLVEELRFFGRDPKQLDGQSVMRRGKFGECRAVGWVIPAYGRAQVSINLTNHRVTPAHEVLEECRRIAARRGLVVTGSEIVGVVPFDAMRESGRYYLARQGESRGLPVRDVVETAIQSLGLRDVGAFDPAKSILGMPERGGPLATLATADFADEVSRPSPAPGGGSVAALAGALGAGLGAMVANLTVAKPALAAVHDELEQVAMRCQELKDALLRAMDDDARAFDAVLAAMRMPKGNAEASAERERAIQAAYRRAAEIPLGTAERCLETLEQVGLAAKKGLASSRSDAGVGALMAHAGLTGAIDNVRVNLDSIDDPAWTAAIRARVDALERAAAPLLASIRERSAPRAV